MSNKTKPKKLPSLSVVLTWKIQAEFDKIKLNGIQRAFFLVLLQQQLLQFSITSTG